MLDALLDLLFPARADERALRSTDAEAFCARLAPCAVPATRPAAAALLAYADPLARAALHEAKYHGSARAFTLLAAALADFLPDHLADRFDTNVGHRMSYILAPVPLGRRRRRERGYNQVEEVARRVVRLLGDERFRLDATLLARTRETPTQVSLARAAREENMRGAFAADPSKLAPRASYIILDDVLTTGATLQAALDALVAAGAPRDRLIPLVLAH